MTTQTENNLSKFATPSFLDSLVSNSQSDLHYHVRNKDCGTLVWLWVDLILNDIPSDWNDVLLRLRHPHGDFESTTMKVIELSQNVIHLQADSDDNASITLRMSKSSTENVLFDGVFIRGNLPPEQVQILPGDCSPNILVSPFTYLDSKVSKGDRIFHIGMWWTFVEWGNSSGCVIKLLSGRLKYPSVENCRRMLKRPTRGEYPPRLAAVQTLKDDKVGELLELDEIDHLWYVRQEAKLLGQEALLVAQLASVRKELDSLQLKERYVREHNGNPCSTKHSFV